MVGKFASKNLLKCLDQEWEIPFDVSITVKSKDGKTSIVGAHKVILAMSGRVFKDNLYLKDCGETTSSDNHLLIENCDEAVVKMLVKYCYTGGDVCRELSGKSVKFLIDLYCLADKFELKELQDVVLKQKKLSQLTKEDMDPSGCHCILSSSDAFDLIEASMDILELEKLCDALLSRAAVILKAEFFGTAPFVFENRSVYRPRTVDNDNLNSKYCEDCDVEVLTKKAKAAVIPKAEFFGRELLSILNNKITDQNLLEIMKKKLGFDDVCRNCKMVPCISGSAVNMKNFQPGARVKVKNVRDGKGNAALVKLGQITQSAKYSALFSGFSASGIPVPILKLKPGVYVFDCSQCLD